MLFATLAVAATALLSWVSYRGVRDALEAEFVRRLENLAGTIASQVSPEDIADARALGEEGQGYAALQVLLEEMRATSQLENAAAFDTARHVLYDCRGEHGPGSLAELDPVAAPGLDRSLAGRRMVSPVYAHGATRLRAGFAPILTDAGSVAGAVMVETLPEDDRVLAGLRRDFLLRTLLAALAMVGLGAVLLRVAWSSQQLERRLSRAENLAAMGQLTATLAHEIKNPLAIIRGSAERLGKLDPEARRMADYVIEESDRLTRTLTRYLRFASHEPGTTGDGNITAVLDATLALVEGELAKRKVTLVREIAVENIGGTLDNESLKQVYLNLILNALEAMGDGGTLTVRASVVNQRAEVRVTDTGPGFAPEVLKRIASPFFTTREKGSGLGLFLSRRLVESAGGTLAFESEPGKGATCIMRLPIRTGVGAGRG